MIGRARVLAYAVAATAIFAADAATAAERNYPFGIVPQQSATRLAADWVPLMRKLSEETGKRILFTTTKDIPTFEKCLSAGAYEFAYMNPYHYVVFHEKAGYEAFAHQAGAKLKGILVARKDGKVNSLDDLSGTSIAFPSPAAFGASVLPRAELRQRGISFLPQYVKSHDSVYRSVAAGLHPAGGGVTRTFNNLPGELGGQLRVIYQTREYTPHAFAAAPSVDAAVTAAVADALVRIGASSPALLEPLGMKGFVKAQDAAWDDVRALNLSRDETEIVEGGTVCRSD